MSASNEQDVRATRIRVAQWEVDASTNRLVCGSRSIKLEPRVMAVLVYLAHRPGRTVSRAELEESVWAGTVVSYDAVTGAIQKLRKALGDDRTTPSYIETLSKKGYRLIAPVEQLPDAAGEPAKTTPKTRFAGLRRMHVAYMAGLLFLAVIIVGILLQDEAGNGRQPQPALSGPRTVAVLPFANLSSDAAQDYFAEGLGDDLIAALARYSNLHVISRDSTAFYKDEALEASELGDRLNVQFLVKGGVRRDGADVRVTLRLINSHSGEVLWSEIFEDRVSRLFELQDRVTHQTVVALTGRMNVRDRQELGRPRTDSLEAYDHFLYGRQQFFLYASAEENRDARDSFRRAIAIDPDFALAYAMLAWTHAFDAMNGWGPSRSASLEKAAGLAARAIEFDAVMPVAYFVRGLAYRELGERARALVEAEKAITYDPNYAGAYVLLATLLYFDGKADEGVQLIKKAIALNPNHPYNYSFHLGQAYYLLKQYDDAIRAFEKVLETNPSVERAHLWLAAAYGQRGRIDDAEWEAEQVLTSNPELSLAKIEKAYPFGDAADRAHFIDGLRLAGISD